MTTPYDAPTLAVLRETAETALAYLQGLGKRRVAATATVEELRATLGGPLPEELSTAAAAVARLAEGAGPGVVATAGPRYFGFVTGGSLPAALAAEWLAGAWDQNAALGVLSPAAAVVEEVAGVWLAELLGLPPVVSFGFVTGGQMANVTGLAAARHHVLERAGWDVGRDGLAGGPPVRVVVGEERHVTVDQALRQLGLGAPAAVVPADAQGRLRADTLADTLEGLEPGPLIVCAQAGNVNTGSFDPLDAVCEATHARGGWVHVDGAFGLWAAASDARRPLIAGHGRADSWATDAHKWLNVPYDCGLAFCAHPDAHRAAMGVQAGYLVPGGDVRDPMDYVPEVSRRARGLPVYAALRSLGRSGVAELVDRCCALARRFADALDATEGIEIRNEVVLNQVLVAFPGQDSREVIARVQTDGTCWLGGTTWHGEPPIRISVSNRSTTEQDVDRSVKAILRCVEG